MAHGLQPRPKDREEALRIIWNRTLKNMRTRSYEIEREFGVKISPHELEKMSFEAVISRIHIDTSSQKLIPPQASPASKPNRESTKLTPEEEAKARRLYDKLNW